MPAQPTRPYHHGDLRPALLRAAVEAIGHAGPAAMSLREVARSAGVTHAAAAYHFGDKAGLLTAVAVQGYRLLAQELQIARDARRGFREVGVAYVRFAVRHRAHFEVMYRPELYRPDDAEVREARAATAAALYGTASPDAARLAAGAAAWSLVHGLATLWLNGNLPEGLGSDPEEITRLVAPYLNVPEGMRSGVAPLKARGQRRVPPSLLLIFLPGGRTGVRVRVGQRLVRRDLRVHPLVPGLLAEFAL